MSDVIDRVAVTQAAPPEHRAAKRLTTLPELAKFTTAVALLAILSDAAVGHALLWENDPYWTYWVTKTFLIATVFGLGSAWIGIGVRRGAALTAVHTVVLTVYYWSLSPIGLPSSPEWLDLQHTWVTGVPVHFGVIYLGYLAALWIWRRRGIERDDNAVGTDVARALVAGLTIVVAAGSLEALVLQEFPGITWFLVRLLITVPFVLLWWAFAGKDRVAAVGGGITLAFILATYSHFLGPLGLPNADLRLLTPDPPPAEVHWASYQDEFLIALPITIVVAVLALIAAAPPKRRPSRPQVGRLNAALATLSIVGLIAAGAVTALNTGPGDEANTVTAAGTAEMESGAFYHGDMEPVQATLQLLAEPRNPRVTPLRPHDRIDLEATITGSDGTRYEVRANEPMIADARGRHATWHGVGLDRWHHGRSGIGSPLLPAIRSDVAIFALGEVQADGELIAADVPIHVMTLPSGGVELQVGDPETPIRTLPDDHLRVVWADWSGESPEAPERARHILGTLTLLSLIGLALLAIRSQYAQKQFATNQRP